MIEVFYEALNFEVNATDEAIPSDYFCRMSHLLGFCREWGVWGKVFALTNVLKNSLLFESFAVSENDGRFWRAIGQLCSTNKHLF